MTRLRLLLGEMPTLLRDILHDAIAGAPDFELVADEQAEGTLDAAIRRHAPDVVVLAAPGAVEAERAGGVLRAAPHARVVSIVAGGHHAAVYELRPHRTPLDEPSVQALLDAIRAERAFPFDRPIPR